MHWVPLSNSARFFQQYAALCHVTYTDAADDVRQDNIVQETAADERPRYATWPFRNLPSLSSHPLWKHTWAQHAVYAFACVHVNRKGYLPASAYAFLKIMYANVCSDEPNEAWQNNGSARPSATVPYRHAVTAFCSLPLAKGYVRNAKNRADAKGDKATVAAGLKSKTESKIGKRWGKYMPNGVFELEDARGQEETRCRLRQKRCRKT